MRVDELGGGDLGSGVAAVALHDQPVALLHVPHAGGRGGARGRGQGREQNTSVYMYIRTILSE